MGICNRRKGSVLVTGVMATKQAEAVMASNSDESDFRFPSPYGGLLPSTISISDSDAHRIRDWTNSVAANMEDVDSNWCDVLTEEFKSLWRQRRTFDGENDLELARDACTNKGGQTGTLLNDHGSTRLTDQVVCCRLIPSAGFYTTTDGYKVDQCSSHCTFVRDSDKEKSRFVR